MKKGTAYNLPRPHLSWSQCDLVMRDPAEYARSYILGEPRYQSEAMMTGRQFADRMEVGKAEQDDPAALKFLVEIGMPRLALMEHRMELEVKGIPVVCILDTAAEDLTAFRETKTGMKPWDQRRVDEHGQLKLYALAIFMKTGRHPECHLDFVRTGYSEQTGELEVQGEVLTFKRRPFTLMDYRDITAFVEKAAERITGLMREQGR